MLLLLDMLAKSWSKEGSKESGTRTGTRMTVCVTAWLFLRTQDRLGGGKRCCRGPWTGAR